MLLAMFLQVSMHASGKYLLQTYSFIQTIWARYFFYLVLVVLALFLQGKNLVRTSRLRSQILRGISLLMVTGFYFLSLRRMKIAEANALYMTSPFMVMLLSTFFLKKKIASLQWVSIVLGGLGTLIILKPGADMIQWAALFPLLAALSLAINKLYTSSLNDTEPILTSLFYSALVGTIVMSILLPLSWQWPSNAGWAQLALLGALGAAFQFAFVKALSEIPAFLATTFNYTQLVWSIMFGLILFREYPGIWTLVGGCIICGCGILSVWIYTSKGNQNSHGLRLGNALSGYPIAGKKPISQDGP